MPLFSCQIFELLGKKVHSAIEFKLLVCIHTCIRTNTDTKMHVQCFFLHSGINFRLNCNRATLRDLENGLQSISALRAASLLPCHSLKSLLFCYFVSALSISFYLSVLCQFCCCFLCIFFLCTSKRKIAKRLHHTINFTLSQTEIVQCSSFPSAEMHFDAIHTQTNKLIDTHTRT